MEENAVVVPANVDILQESDATKTTNVPQSKATIEEPKDAAKEVIVQPEPINNNVEEVIVDNGSKAAEENHAENELNKSDKGTDSGDVENFALIYVDKNNSIDVNETVMNTTIEASDDVVVEEKTSNCDEDKSKVVIEEVVVDEVEVKSEPETNSVSVTVVNVEIQNKKPNNVAEAIASDWSFSDDVVEVVTPVKSSAEIIALDWDDGESKGKKDEETDGTDINGTPVVIEEEPTEKPGEIIIYDEVSEIHVDENNAADITFVTVNENNEIIASSTTTTTTESSDVKPAAKRKSWRSIPDYLLGHNADDPEPQSRLGVKIPCRHLRSVICSKAEIEKEVVEMKTIRHPDIPPGGDVLFATKLFHNLANKILKKTPSKDNASSDDKTEARKKVSDQELIKILEGEDGIDVYNMEKNKESSPPLLTAENSNVINNKNIHNTPPELDMSPTVSTLPSTSSEAGLVMLSSGEVIMDPDLAREIALKQLSEIPENTPRRRGRPKATAVEINVPNTKIIDNNEGNNDPFTFDEGPKPVPPIKYESGTVKTYSRKSITEEPELNEIPVPVEIIENETGVDKNNFRKNMRTRGGHVDTPAVTNRKSKNETTSPPSESSTPDVKVSTRSRIIKKKIIWDPSSSSPPPPPPPKESPTSGKLKKKIAEEETPKKKVKISPKTPKDDKAETDDKIPVVLEEIIVQVETDKADKQQPGSPSKKKKRFSEVDKLLMDEGALNMIYAVEKDEKTPLIKNKQKVISIDTFTKEMRKKKRMIMSALVTSPEVNSKALRKKDLPAPTASPAPQRKKSHDSVRSSIQSPPPSPSSMFPPRAEASRIIRRHSSSSSFSSECMSPRRLSVVEADKSKENSDNTFWNDVPDSKEKSTEATPRSNKRKRGVPIFVKKNEEKTYRGKPSETTPTRSEKRLKLQKSAKDENNAADKAEMEKRKEASRDAESYASLVKTLDSENQQRQKESDEKHRTSGRQNAGTYNYKEISLRKFDNLVQIILTPQTTKIKNALNVAAMRELCDALNVLKKDSSCRVIMLTSAGNIFCRGLDYASLIHSNADKRKALAQDMASGVKELVQTLGHFPKPVIAGVQGAVYGLGVALLPLCDLVFVSDKATFTMNHSKLGCIPEGAATVSIPHVASHAVASELLLAGHTLTATEALRHGLATRILWPEGYLKELIPICKTIALKSSQGMNSTKSLIKHSLLLKVEATLDSETHLLVQHWTSAECQQNFKNALENDSW